MNKQFIIKNFAAFAFMLFLPTGCRQADGKQDAVQSLSLIHISRIHPLPMQRPCDIQGFLYGNEPVHAPEMCIRDRVVENTRKMCFFSMIQL